VEDARRRAYAPRVYLLGKKAIREGDGLPGQARQ
jgi:hypothetical protein